MKHLFAAFLFLLLHTATAQTQAEMNGQAYAAYQQADKELNEVYRRILKEYKADVTFIQDLKASQRIWISFRDAELNMLYPEREVGYYGSVHAICRADYLEQLTCERLEKLKRWLTGTVGEDVCSGSIKATN
ncbi:lysozyme inhibitor LprI family protein [Pontibacter roseus]|uniref:lysozyme inhibitor LprI family protein n=1 Tax=Pontibacter roseus TaxID=336989 RepID=UPI0003701864|nr:lysozyme inhibitor LprI family protein [Pontibacter roseus]